MINKFLIQQDYWYFYIVGWGKTGPAHSFPPPKYFALSIDQLVFRFMLLFHCILTLMNDCFQRENQVFKPNIYLYCFIVGWGKTGPAHSSPTPPPPKCSDLSIYLSVFQFMLFFYCIWRLMNDSFQRDNQIFKPKSLLVISLQSVPTFVFYLSELIFPNSGLGKDWVDFPLTHSNNHFELRTYSFCFLNRLTIYNQILIHALHFCAVLRVVEL